jgi:hypothetical protein
VIRTFPSTTNHWQDVDDDADPDRYKSEYIYDPDLARIFLLHLWRGSVIRAFPSNDQPNTSNFPHCNFPFSTLPLDRVVAERAKGQAK